jgi:homocysteine S-methyltransferase
MTEIPKTRVPTLFSKFIERQGLVLLDGALATELEQRGANLNDSLWSAKLLTENPDLIRQVHYDYILAGANIITTASYQASYTGFLLRGYSENQARALMQLSVQLAREAREQACADADIAIPPLIAASIGPYGAFLADGSEYTGHYGLTKEALMDFHRPRIQVLLDSGADLLACETIPCIEEASALIALLETMPNAKAWLSFSCQNGHQTCQGDDFAACIEQVQDCKQVVAVGINCTAPQYIESLVRIAAKVTDKPIVVYPNKGETYDAVEKCWHTIGQDIEPFVVYAQRWYAAGARLIGGCCRTRPQDIRDIGRVLPTFRT